MPVEWKDHPAMFISNISAIMVIGIMGNLFTLVTVPYASKKYKSKFPNILNLPTILLLHLSFCDLLYCSMGLPVFVMITFTNIG